MARGSGADGSDSRTLAGEVLYESIEYGEGQPAGLNLATRVFRQNDSGGIVTNMGHNPVTNQDEGFDFNGQSLVVNLDEVRVYGLLSIELE